MSDVEKLQRRVNMLRRSYRMTGAALMTARQADDAARIELGKAVWKLHLERKKERDDGTSN